MPNAFAAQFADFRMDSAVEIAAAIDVLKELFFFGGGASPSPRLPVKVSTVVDLLDAGALEAVSAALRSAPDSARVQARVLTRKCFWGCSAW